VTGSTIIDDRNHVAARLHQRAFTWLFGDHAAAGLSASVVFAIRVCSAGVVFGSQILLARVMGSVEYGNYIYVWTWLLLLGDIVHFGFPLTAQRQIPEYRHQNSFALLRGYVTGSRWMTFGLATLTAIAGALIVCVLASGSSFAMPLYLACAALPFFALSFMLDGISRSYNWVALGLIPASLLRPVLILAFITALHSAGVSLNATTAMVATLAAIWITTLGHLFLLNRRLAHVVPSGDRNYDYRSWFRISIPLVVAWGFYTLLTGTDVLVLRLFRPAYEVAHYYAASKTLTLVTFVYFAVSAAAAHRFTAYHVAGDRDGLADFAARTIGWIFWPTLVATIGILALGWQILSLFGREFTAAYPVMFILAIGLLARAAVGPAGSMLTMVGEQRACAFAYAAAFLVALTGCFVLTERFGGPGVAAATSAAFVTESALLYLIARHRLSVHLFIWRWRGR
jgi:O-antigen/teichoic acid export membrane protein